MRSLTTAAVFAITIVLAGCTDQGVLFVELQADRYSVPRYTNYPTITVNGVINTASIDLIDYEITADCEEHTFESLTHRFRGSFSIMAGETKDIQIPYESGFPYFTDLRVRCDIGVPTRLGQAIVSIAWVD